MKKELFIWVNTAFLAIILTPIIHYFLARLIIRISVKVLPNKSIE